ncbi:MAG TPA: DUF4386 domain-containing protein [Chthoniobacterales bacterium]|nr:DUF4386 domain-containing protein [Chthoniobacterales bacterium]
MHPTVKVARIAGAIYLSTLPIALYCWSYIPGKLIVRGNAAVTGENILAHETWFRVSILGDLVGHVIFICLGFVLYRLLRDVNRTWAVAMLGFVLVQGAVGFLNALNSIATVILFRGADFLAVIDKAQRDALAMFFLRLHGQGFVVNEIFWGVWLFPFGLLVYRSRFLPRFFGAWLIVACFAWLVLSVSELLYPGSSATISKPVQLVTLGEMAIALWLLIRGANVQALTAQPA